jgi:pimeloyl-ACP methyl ester carboxylesterase/DNA-binding CsgD family transcriptional regulator
MQPQIQYALTDDEVRIAYFRMGEGVPFLVASEIIWSHLGSTHGLREYYRSRSGHGVGRGMEVVRYDARGTGLSDRTPDAFARECLLLDIEAVRKAVGFERFVLFGHMNGCISAIEYAAAFPERIEALVLVSPWLDGRKHLALSEHFGLQPVAGMSERQWEGFTDTVAMHALGAGVTDASRKLGRVYREAMTPEAYLAFLEWRRTIDLTEAARSVCAPTLVIRRESALRYPSDLNVARTIPNAHLVTIPPREGPFQAWNDSETEAIEDFLAIPPVTAVAEHEPVSIRTKMEAAGLTQRELQVLKLIAEGRSSQEMARALTLSEHTIARHIANIYRKTGAHGRVEAAAYARRYGIA